MGRRCLEVSVTKWHLKFRSDLRRRSGPQPDRRYFISRYFLSKRPLRLEWESGPSMRLQATICVFFLLLGSMSASALQFAADIIQIDKNGTRNSGKVYVLDGRVRIEIANFPDGFFLIDGANAYFVRRSTRTYMEARR